MLEFFIIGALIGWLLSILIRAKNKMTKPHVEHIEQQLQLAKQKKAIQQSQLADQTKTEPNIDQKKPEPQIKLIGPGNLNTLDTLFEMIQTIKQTNTTIIITNPHFLEKGIREQIHVHCNEFDVISRKVTPAGPSGLFMVIEPKSPYVTIGMTMDDFGKVFHDDPSVRFPGITANDLELFVRLAGLPIDKKLLKSNEHFRYKLSVLDEFNLKHGNPGLLSPKQMFELFIDLKKKALKANQDVITYVSNVSKQIEDYIKNTDQYKAFNESKDLASKKGKRDDRRDMHSTNPYKVGIDEFWGISVDIRSANYNILRLFHSSIVGNTVDWLAFINMFTNDNFLAESKPFRQETLGKLNASRIANCQKTLLADLVALLQKNNIDIDGNINSDELIIPARKDDASKLLEKVKQIVNQTEHPEIWRVERFRVKPLLPHSTTAFYPFVRDTFIDEKRFWTAFACISKVYITQAIKYFMKKPIERGDLLVGDEFNNIHTFDYPIVGKVEN